MLRPLLPDVRKSLDEATTLYESQLTDPLPPYLADRLTHRNTVEAFRLGLVGTSPETVHPGHEMYAGRLAIPYLGPNGVQGMRFRCLEGHECASVGCPKFLGLGGVPTRLYNTRAVVEASDRIYITEGEGDTWTLHQLGVAAVGVPGANNWKEHHSRVFSGFSDVVVIGDHDSAGEDFVKKVLRAITHARSVSLQGEAKEDVTSFYVKKGETALRSILGIDYGRGTG